MRYSEATLHRVSVDVIRLIIKPLTRETTYRIITELHNWRATGGATTWKGKYWTRSDIPLSDSTSVFVEVAYTRGETYVTIKWNPSKFMDTEWQQFLRVLRTFSLTYDELLRRGRISYLEIAADYIGVDSGELFVYHPTLKSGKRKPRNEKIFPTFYIGSYWHSNYWFCIYAKAQQIDPRSVDAVTRIEARYRRLNMSAADLLANPYALPNRFLPLWVCDSYRARRLARAYRTELGISFLARADELDPQTAFLEVMPASRRHFLMKLFRIARCRWWQQDEIWEALPAAINRGLICPISQRGDN